MQRQDNEVSRDRGACRWPAALALAFFSGAAGCAGTGTGTGVGAGAGVGAASPVAPALDRATKTADEIVAVRGGKRTFDNTIGRYDDLIAQLELDTNMLMFMAYVSTDAAQREAGSEAEEAVTKWRIRLNKREDLYRAVKSYADTKPRLAGEQKRLLEHIMRDYRRAGMTLPAKKRARLLEIQDEITELSIEFETNIREDGSRVPLTRGELGGLPEAYFENPNLKRSGDIYLVGLAYPQFFPIMGYCDNEVTRKKVWLAYKRRGGTKNVRIIEKILTLRAAEARLLGFAHAADYEIEIKMAKNAANVQAFYDKLRPLVRRKALQDYDELVTAKSLDTGDRSAKLYPWDSDFYINWLKKTKFAVDPEKVREYFPLERVVEGLFSITQSLYGLQYKDVTGRAASKGRPLWHEDVRLYEVWDTARGEMLGEFYLDMHPRPDKYTHAAQWGLAQHKEWSDGRVTKPLAALVCNFPKPTASRPSLLTHDDVETFFHEFGHCLHTILSEARYFTFSGTSVERDFVEAPSQMFENWVWDADVLRTFARHYKTNRPFPDKLLTGMIKGRHLSSGMIAERQMVGKSPRSWCQRPRLIDSWHRTCSTS